MARCYPFHPSLIRLAEEEWSQHAGFQRVRSTIQVFAATVYELAERGGRGEWAPQLIGPGDLPLSARSVRDSLLDSGLVTDHRTGASLREIAAAEVADPDHPERGTARRLDLHREPVGWNSNNPRAAERAATALFVYSVCPRPGGRRDAVWRLCSVIAEAVDGDVTHIQMTIQLTASSAVKDKIAAAAEGAGVAASVRDL